MLLSCLWLVLDLLFMLLPFKKSPSFIIKRLTSCKREALIPSLSLKVETVCSLSSPLDSVVFNNTACNSSKTFFSMGRSFGSLHLPKFTIFDTSEELKFDWNLLSVSGVMGAQGGKKSHCSHIECILKSKIYKKETLLKTGDSFSGVFSGFLTQSYLVFFWCYGRQYKNHCYWNFVDTTQNLPCIKESAAITWPAWLQSLRAYPDKYQKRYARKNMWGHTKRLETILWKAGNLWRDWGNGDGHDLRATLPTHRGNSHG